MTRFPILDGHNDLAWHARTTRDYATAGVDQTALTLHTDIPKMREGGLGGQFWSVYVDDTDLAGADLLQAVIEQIDFVHRLAADYPDTFALATTAAEARAAMGAGRIASLLGMEGGGGINNSLAALREFARLGVRYLTLTWNKTLPWADAAVDAPLNNGLSDFGREVVREMQRIGMLVDLSHVSVPTMNDALDVATRPVIVSHSCAFALNPHPRNVPDDVIARIAAGGGVQMVTFVPGFVSDALRAWRTTPEAERDGPAPQATLAQVADHFDHVREVAGIDHIGIGGDFDGTDEMPLGIEHVGKYPALLAELTARGWSDTDLTKLAHENILRVLEDVDAEYAAFLAAGRL
ncbi:dipeptidase [Micrococcales bacterium 31B]|nr:dipeptidase [Micrococcales bacterium 31B]